MQNLQIEYDVVTTPQLIIDGGASAVMDSFGEYYYSLWAGPPSQQGVALGLNKTLPSLCVYNTCFV